MTGDMTTQTTRSYESLQGLNAQQLEAVQHVDGPLLILAGAGSGKTKALTHRIAYLLEAGHAQPYNILAVTFTNKAAREIKERIVRLTGDEGRDMRVGTFHSICSQLLRRELARDGRANFTVYDDGDQTTLIKEAMLAANIGERQFSPAALRGAISTAKNELIGPTAFEPHTYFEEIVRRVYIEYQKRLRDANAMDFDDLILETVRYLQEHPDRCTYLGRRFRYISVDEYQDTNHAQYMLTKLLAQEHHNITVVGDDDQSIYGWRGADIRNILEFERDYPEATVIKLEQNYRSTQTILDAAHAVVSRNKGRKDKKLWTENDKGVKIKRVELDNEAQEATYVVNEARRLVARDECAYKDIAVMYRTNAQSRAVEKAFVDGGLQYILVGGVRFYERKEIKDALAYLRLLYNPYDVISLARIINVPPRRISPPSVSSLREWGTANGWNLREAVARAGEVDTLDDKARKAVLTFAETLEVLERATDEYNVLTLLDLVLERVGYAAHLRDGTAEGEDRWLNIQELRSVAADFAALQPRESLSSFLEQVALVADVDRLKEDPNGVTLITLHAAKGLEYQVVFLCGMEEGIFPHSRSLEDPLQMEEERRLAYVGITRAKKYLYLLSARTRTLYGNLQMNAPSRFMEDVPADLIQQEHVGGSRRSSGRGAGSTPRGGARPGSKSAWPPADRAGEDPPHRRSSASWGDGIDEEPSPPRRAVQMPFQPGERVRHKVFGLGTIIKSEDSDGDEEVTVEFRDGRDQRIQKKLIASYAGLERL